MGNQKKLAIQILKILLSFLTFASLVITFINGIQNKSLMAGIPLSMFIFAFTKFTDFIEQNTYIKKESGENPESEDENRKSKFMMGANIVSSLILMAISLVLSFADIPDEALFAFNILALLFAIYYLAYDVHIFIPQLIDYQET